MADQQNIKTFVYNKTNTTHSGCVVDAVGEFDVVACESCGFKHVIPIPSDEELEKFYGEEFYSHAKPNYFAHYEEDLPWWMVTYANYYSLLRKYAPGKRLLDIGSGPGYFLKCGKNLGWDVLGFEPSRDAVKYSSKLGVEVVNDFFSQKSIRQYGTFDVVHMKTVIEHIPDPISLLRDAVEVLNPGGLLCVITPNDYNSLQGVLRNKLGFKPWWVSPPQHLNYFDFASMRNVLEKLGLSIVESLGTFPMEFFLLSGINYVGNDEVGRQCQLRRKTFESNMYDGDPEILNDMYRSLGTNGIGREFVLIAKKKI